MEKLVKRILALILVNVTLFSLIIVPAHASLADGIGYGVSTFWEYINTLGKENNWTIVGWWQSIVGSDDPTTAYSSYASGIQSDLGTSTIINGGVRIYGTVISIDGGYASCSQDSLGLTNFFTNVTMTTGDTLYGHGSVNVACRIGTAAFACSYVTGAFYMGTNCNPDTFVSHTGNLSSGQSLTITCGADVPDSNYPSVIATFSGIAYADITPTAGSVSDYTTSNITVVSRPTSFAAPLGYYDSSNNLVADTTNTPIFNETTNNYYNPVTQQTVPVTDWQYDYQNREYTLTTANGTYTVIYGDQNITINEAGTTYNVYYVTSSGESDTPTYSGDDVGWTWWSKAWSDFTGWFKGLPVLTGDTSALNPDSSSGSSSSEEPPSFYSIDNSTGDITIDSSYDFSGADESGLGFTDVVKATGKGIWALVKGAISIFAGAVFSVGSAVSGLSTIGKASNQTGAFAFFYQGIG